MTETLVCCLVGFLLPLAWWCGYHYGKVDGIRQVRHLMDEQWKDYESFRDLVFRELGWRWTGEHD